MDPTPTWVESTLRIIVVTCWVALILGIVASAASATDTGVVVAAAFLGGGFVVPATFLPAERAESPGLVIEILVTAGAVLTVAAVTLTGGASSPFLLLALTPSFLAAVLFGHRTGLTTALLTAGLLGAVVWTADGARGLASAAGTFALFPLLALVVAQIRTLLVDVTARATSLEQASVQAEAELARLGQANELLRRLADVYGDGRASPVDLGRSALEAIIEANPGSFATATMFDSNGPMVVARVGTDQPDLVRTQIPLGEAETSSGVVSVATPQPLTDVERQDIDRLLRPVAVSFANTLLLQEIASTAVREERLRLARELHDEVGPALAALGLSLDATQMHTTDPVMKDSLSYVREGLGTVVDDLRGIIADLRAETAGSLTTELKSAVAELASPPAIAIDIHERRPPRSVALRQILAIVTESVRNAYRHAGAQSVKVGGTVDRDRVDIEVVDDGKGFDPAVLPEGHYGVLGMRERADRIGATIDIDSGSHGTSVRLAWKEKK